MEICCYIDIIYGHIVWIMGVLKLDCRQSYSHNGLAPWTLLPSRCLLVFYWKSHFFFLSFFSFRRCNSSIIIRICI